MSTLTPMSPEELRAFEESERQKTSVERALFERHRDEWERTHPGSWVLLKGPRCLGFYASFEEAYTEGNRLFEEEPIFIKKLLKSGAEEPLSLGLLHGVLVLGD